MPPRTAVARFPRRELARLAVAATLSIAAGADAGCWAPHDKALWADDEVDGRLTLSFRNAVDCTPVADAEVDLGEREYRTDAAGLLRLPGRDNGNAAARLRINAAGYPSTELPLAATAPRFALSPALGAATARLVLSWGEQPADLDLYLLGPDFRLGYRQTRQHPGEARLERAADDGYGPETITVERLRPDARYEVWVHNRSGEAPLDPRAQLQVHLSTGVQSIALPATALPWFRVATIENGRLQAAPRAAAAGP